MVAGPAEIWKEAAEAAQEAAARRNAELPPESQRGFDVGFAWVIVRPARGHFISWCKNYHKGHTRDYGGGGFEIPHHNLHSVVTQSVDVHGAAARAFAEVLRRHGLDAWPDQRLD